MMLLDTLKHLAAGWAHLQRIGVALVPPQGVTLPPKSHIRAPQQAGGGQLAKGHAQRMPWAMPKVGRLASEAFLRGHAFVYGGGGGAPHPVLNQRALANFDIRTHAASRRLATGLKADSTLEATQRVWSSPYDRVH